MILKKIYGNYLETQPDWFPSLVLLAHTFATAVTTFFMAVYFKDGLGFSGNQIGILFSAQAVTGMLAAIPAGIGNDRFSSRNLIIAGLLAQAACFFLMAFIKTFLTFAAVFFLCSLSSWVFRLSIDIHFLKTKTNRAIGNRIGFFQAWRYIGLAIGTVVTGYFIARLDFAISLVAVGIACFFLAVLSGSMRSTSVARVRWADYKADFSNRKVLLFSAWMLLFATHWGAEQTSYGLFLKRQLHLSFSGMGWYMASEFLAIIFAVLIGGSLIGKRELGRKIAIFGLAASGLGHIGMIIPLVHVSVLFRILHGIGDGCMILILYYGIYRFFALEHLGGNTGMINLITMIGYIVGATVYGPLGEFFGYGHPFWISGLSTIFLIIPLVAIRPHSSASYQADKPLVKIRITSKIT